MPSTAVVSRRTGRRPFRATAQPAMPAATTPAAPKSSITPPSLASTFSCGSSDWAMLSACPEVEAGTVTTR